MRAGPTGLPEGVNVRVRPPDLRIWRHTWTLLIALALVAVGAHGRAAPGPTSLRSPNPAPQKPPEVPPTQDARPAQPERPPARKPWLTPLWTSALPAAPAGTPAYDATLAYVPLRNQRLAAIELASGKPAWSQEIASLDGVAAGDGLVFVSVPAAIQALAAADGSARWRLGVEGRVKSPMLWDHGWLIAVTEAGTAMAIRANDGQVIWQKPLGAVMSVVPALGVNRAYFALDDGRVVARQLATGEPIWERRLGGKPAEILVLEDRLFVGATDNILYCLAVKDGSVKWRWRAGADVVGQPAADHATVYFVSLDHMMRALNRHNGRQRWRQFLSTRPSGGPLPFDGTTLLVAGVAAEVWAYRPKDGALEADVSAPAELAAPPHAGRLSTPDRAILVLLTLDGRMQVLVRSAS